MSDKNSLITPHQYPHHPHVVSCHWAPVSPMFTPRLLMTDWPLGRRRQVPALAHRLITAAKLDIESRLLLHNTGPLPRASDPIINIKCFCPWVNYFFLITLQFHSWIEGESYICCCIRELYLSGTSDAYVMETWGLSALDLHIKCMFSRAPVTCDNMAADVMTHCVTQPPGHTGWVEDRELSRDIAIWEHQRRYSPPCALWGK